MRSYGRIKQELDTCFEFKNIFYTGGTQERLFGAILHLCVAGISCSSHAMVRARPRQPPLLIVGELHTYKLGI